MLEIIDWGYTEYPENAGCNNGVLRPFFLSLSDGSTFGGNTCACGNGCGNSCDLNRALEIGVFPDVESLRAVLNKCDVEDCYPAELLDDFIGD